MLLSVRLGNTLEFVLLLDGVAVGAALGGVDQLIGQTFGDRLDVAERRLASASAQQPDGLQNRNNSPTLKQLKHWVDAY